MQNFLDFVAGRNNKLLRDFIGLGMAIIAISMTAMFAINGALVSLHESRLSSLPAKQTRPAERSDQPITTITRSVLDDNLVTGSVQGRPIILDPCTGKEKK